MPKSRANKNHGVSPLFKVSDGRRKPQQIRAGSGDTPPTMMNVFRLDPFSESTSIPSATGILPFEAIGPEEMFSHNFQVYPEEQEPVEREATLANAELFDTRSFFVASRDEINYHLSDLSPISTLSSLSSDSPPLYAPSPIPVYLAQDEKCVFPEAFTNHVDLNEIPRVSPQDITHISPQELCVEHSDPPTLVPASFHPQSLATREDSIDSPSIASFSPNIEDGLSSHHYLLPPYSVLPMWPISSYNNHTSSSLDPDRNSGSSGLNLPNRDFVFQFDAQVHIQVQTKEAPTVKNGTAKIRKQNQDVTKVTRSLKKNEKGRHVCPLCPRKFNLANGLSIHLKWHRNQNAKAETMRTYKSSPSLIHP
ncbi:hypothetical protein JAAARDRAFT_78239 [Jaapia argillacea MUCL 33604]|uniref:C2H2-type domain-containing protein n=1 Tax=Jaapia argillacea MUCL 33604 TaxID=933084 RepID=A0A067Q4X2_9AGAM|nr:hypothetical protein JAAARDRAFT_78239 [Jaapia argillacea MUCL 33604]